MCAAAPDVVRAHFHDTGTPRRLHAGRASRNHPYRRATGRRRSVRRGRYVISASRQISGRCGPTVWGPTGSVPRPRRGRVWPAWRPPPQAIPRPKRKSRDRDAPQHPHKSSTSNRGFESRRRSAGHDETLSVAKAGTPGGRRPKAAHLPGCESPQEFPQWTQPELRTTLCRVGAEDPAQAPARPQGPAKTSCLRI